MDIPSTDTTQADTKPTKPEQQQSSTPRMGDTRVINGQKQVYFRLRLGLIIMTSQTNVSMWKICMRTETKLVVWAGGTIVDGDGDINKMVGTTSPVPPTSNTAKKLAPLITSAKASLQQLFWIT